MEWNTVERAITTDTRTDWKDWASSVGLCLGHRPQHTHHEKVSPRGRQEEKELVKSPSECAFTCNSHYTLTVGHLDLGLNPDEPARQMAYVSAVPKIMIHFACCSWPIRDDETSSEHGATCFDLMMSVPMLECRESFWPSGEALGWKAEGPRFDPFRLSFLFKKFSFVELIINWNDLHLCPY